MKIKLFPFTFLIFSSLFAQQLKVVTINVWSGLDYIGSFKMGEYESRETREQRYQILINQLKELDPDIIAINEANKLPRYARRIARDMDCDFIQHPGVAGIHLGPIGMPVNLREGDVILAKKYLHLKSPKHEQLSGGYVGRFFTFHFQDATQVIGGKINVGGQDIYIFNTHSHSSKFANRETLETITEQYLSGEISDDDYLSTVTDAINGKKWRMAEMRKLVEFINKTAGQNPVILAGDFNDLADSEPIAILLQNGFTDTYAAVNSDPGYTWDEFLNRNILTHYQDKIPDEKTARRDRIDYIFSRGVELNINESKVVMNKIENGLHPSDHFGVMTTFKINSNPK